MSLVHTLRRLLFNYRCSLERKYSNVRLVDLERWLLCFDVVVYGLQFFFLQYGVRVSQAITEQEPADYTDR